MQRWQNLRYAAVIAGCALLHYVLAGLIIARLPYANVPPGWLADGSSHLNGLIARFLALNALACWLAAIPVALALVWAIPRHRTLVALAVSTLTTSLVVVQLFGSDLSPVQSSITGYWVNFAGLSLAFLLAVPLTVVVVSTVLRGRGRMVPDR